MLSNEKLRGCSVLWYLWLHIVLSVIPNVAPVFLRVIVISCLRTTFAELSWPGGDCLPGDRRQVLPQDQGQHQLCSGAGKGGDPRSKPPYLPNDFLQEGQRPHLWSSNPDKEGPSASQYNCIILWKCLWKSDSVCYLHQRYHLSLALACLALHFCHLNKT